jgi:hypothetical protein
LKLRQKRPQLAVEYQMKKVRLSKYQKAIKSLREINDMIDKL